MSTNLRSHQWKQQGSVVLWRYTENLRNYPGWQLTADAMGCHSLVELLDAFDADGVAGSRAVNISPPTPAILTVPNNRRAQWVAPTKLRVSFSTTPSQWRFPEALEPAGLTVGAEWLQKLRHGILGIPLGEGDFAIGNSDDGNLPLWFWWQLAVT